jgi:hypothetical protein
MDQEMIKCPFPFLGQYKNIFGESRTGPHSYRFMDFAIVDTLLTIILAYIISIIFNIDLTTCIIYTFIIGEISHYLFCVDTQFILLIKEFLKN